MVIKWAWLQKFSCVRLYGNPFWKSWLRPCVYLHNIGETFALFRSERNPDCPCLWHSQPSKISHITTSRAWLNCICSCAHTKGSIYVNIMLSSIITNLMYTCNIGYAPSKQSVHCDNTPSNFFFSWLSVGMQVSWRHFHHTHCYIQLFPIPYPKAGDIFHSSCMFDIQCCWNVPQNISSACKGMMLT